MSKKLRPCAYCRAVPLDAYYDGFFHTGCINDECPISPSTTSVDETEIRTGWNAWMRAVSAFVPDWEE